jgi:hypothetical protein
VLPWPCHHSGMAKKKAQRGKSLAELAAEPTWSETSDARKGEHAPRPGGVNPAGEFFDPTGVKLTLRRAKASAREAQRAVDDGALVVAEACGCGGGPGGCTPVWLDSHEVRALQGGPGPRFTGKYGSPTWLELWSNDEREVVFAHGDVSWGGRAIG